jgi:tubulin polyglutamylase TTLL6/13
MHLTNYAINKANPEFIHNQSETRTNIGHKRTFLAILDLLRKEGVDIDALLARIEDVLVKAVVASLPPIAHQFKAYQPSNLSSDMCFHIIGADVLLSSKHDPILLEFNHTPSFTTDSPLDRKIKKGVVRDTLRMLGLSTDRKQRMLQERQDYIKFRTFNAKRPKFTDDERLERRDALLTQKF